jgi:acyl-CoA dehydrogenase
MPVHTDTPDLFDLAMSEQARPLMDAVLKHIEDNVVPISEEFFALDKEK